MTKINPYTQVELNPVAILDTAQHYGIDVASFQETPEGISHTVVEVIGIDGLAYFLKYYRSSHSDERVLQEVAFTEQLSAAGLPVSTYVRSPKDNLPVTGHLDANGHHATTLSVGIPGYHPEKYPLSLLEQLGVVHARIHQVSEQYAAPQAFDPFKNYNFYGIGPDEAELSTVGLRVEEATRRMQGIWGKLPNGLVPMDIKRNNMLVDDAGLRGIVDLADINLSPSSFCLAGTLWDVLESGGGRDDVDTYISSYESVRSLSPLEKANLTDIIAIRGWIAIHGALLSEGISPVVGYQINQLDALLHD